MVARVVQMAEDALGWPHRGWVLVQGGEVSLFPGVGVPLPEYSSRTTAGFLTTGEQPAPVRFVDGYLPFEAFVREQGVDPASLVGDVSALWEFLSGQVAVLTGPELMDAATRFAGNVIAVVHPAATWRGFNEPEVGTTTRSIPVTGLVQMMIMHPERKEPFLNMLATWDREDRDHAEYRALSYSGVVPPPVTPPAPFRRPVFPALAFHDESGREITYGTRWEEREPPAEAYSRVTNPTRFAPLALDVNALTEYLRTWYLVDVHMDGEVTEDGTQRIVFQPTTGAHLTMTVGADSVTLEAGALLAHTFPDCSCDACDETATTAADDLERHVLAVAAGGFREVFPVGHRRWTLTQFEYHDGSSTTGGGPPSHELTAFALEEAEETLAQLADGWWPAWTPRQGPSS